MKKSLPYIIVWILLALVFSLLNTEYLMCINLPFGKGDILNYMPMFTGDADIHHALFAAQIKGLSVYLNLPIPYVFAWSIYLKGFLLMPLAYFLYMCSLEGKPKLALYATGLVCIFSWLPYSHMIIGIHAQFEGFFWYLIWLTCGNLRRRGAHDFDLDLVYWGSITLSLLYYPLTVVVFYLHFLSCKKIKLWMRLAPALFIAAGLVYRTPQPLAYFWSFETVTFYTLILLAPLAVLYILCDLTDLNDRKGVYLDVDKTLFTLMFIVGLFAHNHRMALYAVPYLYYRFATTIKPYEMLPLLLLALVYAYYSFDFHLTQMWYEIISEGKVADDCIKAILTRA